MFETTMHKRQYIYGTMVGSMKMNLPVLIQKMHKSITHLKWAKVTFVWLLYDAVKKY